MTDTPSPFDDPEFVEMLNRSGVVDKPGMADELLEVIGPLLAADDFDMTDPHQGMDLDDVNAVMRRAIERRNMELLKPEGTARAMTTAIMRNYVNTGCDGGKQ